MNETTIEIKPCPFCGEQAECHDSGGHDSDNFTYLVTCGTDSCYGDVVLLNRSFSTRSLAIAMWNNRAK